MAPEHTDDSKRGFGSCARCQKVTTTNCGGCLGAPIYEQGPATRIFYCNALCQKSDWDRHKTECRAMQARKSLHRGGMVLQAVMSRIRKKAYPLSVTTVQEEGSKIMLAEEKNLPQRLQPFSALLEGRSELLEVVLMHLGSYEAMVYLYTLARELFDGLYSNIEEVELLPKNRRLQICTAVDGSTPAETQECLHHVYKVTMKNEEVWAVDITGAQYGYPECLYPWYMYERERCERINGTWSLGFFRCHEPPTRVDAAKKDLAESLDSQIPRWAAMYAGKLNNMLKGSKATFQVAKQKFSDQVEAHTQISLQKINHRGAAQEEAPARREADQSGSDDSVSAPTDKVYCIRAVAGKGQGMIATAKIPEGTRILSESPIFRVPRDEANQQTVERIIAREVGRLSEDQRRSFFALHNIHGSSCSHALGIAKTNVLPLGSQAREGGLFVEASRINHSCRHNAQNTWNSNLDKLTIHAFRDIEEGEEITISYLAASETYSERQERLRSGFGFICACDLCSLPPAQRQQSDQRLEKITRLDERIGDGERIVSAPLACLRNAHELLCLLREEGIDDARVPRLYYDALQIAIANGDEARARVFAQNAYAARVILEGNDSPHAIRLKEYAERPATHSLYGMTTKWRQAVTNVPRGLSERQFEDWLWKMKGRAS